MAMETTLWDPAERLTTPEAQAAYLEAALEDGDPAIIAAALEDIARGEGKRAEGSHENRERGQSGTTSGLLRSSPLR
jgi:DNA-binding phage protein